jgi:cytosine/adenosine deaminase-related metal-dependent hydrolase
MGRVLISVRGMVDQGALRFLEALRLASARLFDRALGRIGVLSPGTAADLAGFASRLVGLLLLVRRIYGHRLIPPMSG